MVCGHAHAGGGVFARQRYRTAEEIQAHEGGLAALPGHVSLADLLGLDVLAYILLQDLARSCGTRCRGRSLFLQEEAVGAVEVAGGPARLGHDVKGGRRIGPAT